MNHVHLMGRLVRDPQLFYTKNGVARTRIILAVDKGYSKAKRDEVQSYNKPTADFIQVTFWGKIAETLAQFRKKGDLLIVDGRVDQMIWEVDGEKHFELGITGKKFYFA